MKNFVVFEGVDGSGKTTQAQLLKKELENMNFKVSYFREPGGTDLGENIRKIVLNKEMSPRAELLLFLSSRAELVEKEIMPRLNNSEIVILDRYVDSSVVYQGGVKDIGYRNVFNSCMFATNFLMPDIVYYIDVKPEIAFERISKKAHDKFESSGLQLLVDASKHYLKWYSISSHKAVIIDGNEEINKVQQHVFDYYLSHTNLYNISKRI